MVAECNSDFQRYRRVKRWVRPPVEDSVHHLLLHPVLAYTNVKKTLWDLCACSLCGFTEATAFANAVMHAVGDTPQVHSAMDCTKDDEFESMDSNEAVRPSQHP